MNKEQELKDIVKERYAKIAEQGKEENAASCCGATKPSNKIYNIMMDDYSETSGYNEAADLGLGCGLPTQFANIKKGDTVAKQKIDQTNQAMKADTDAKAKADADAAAAKAKAETDAKAKADHASKQFLTASMNQPVAMPTTKLTGPELSDARPPGGSMVGPRPWFRSAAVMAPTHWKFRRPRIRKACFHLAEIRAPVC